MSQPKGQASYKKLDGVLAISDDRKAVSWTPAKQSDGASKITINATSITNLQQTPESKPKVMLKIFAQEAGQSEPVSHVFAFTSQSDARSEANAIKDTLASVIQAQKAAQAAPTTNGGQSAAMTMAATVAGGARPGNSWEDDEKLKSDVRLQQSLMQQDPTLQKTFHAALSMKPDSISTTQFTAQFWSSRVPQLRAHAIAQNQGIGKYNVFSELRREEGGRKMNLTQDHVRVIFEQYPVMRIIHDEVVPKMKDEIEFWSRFFQSQLFMTLRGLKIDRNKEAKDAMLDKYLDHPLMTGSRATSTEMHIPKFIDLEGNEENHSQRKGNRPDSELRSNALEKAPIIRRLNALSEKIMANVKPSDTDASAPIGMDEATYEQLRLRDLAGDPEQRRIILNIRDQSRFFADNRASEGITSQLRRIDPNKALQSVVADLSQAYPQPGQGQIPIEVEESEMEEYDDDDDADKQPSGSGMASKHILSLIQANRNQTAIIDASSGLSPTIYERVTLTHATTLEFLRQFWSAFLSGDPSRATEIVSLAESLGKALERINSIATDAEQERLAKIKSEKLRADEILRKTGKKRIVDVKAIGGGAEVVKQLLGPMIRSVNTAQGNFASAYEEQMKELDGGGPGNA